MNGSQHHEAPINLRSEARLSLNILKPGTFQFSFHEERPNHHVLVERFLE